MYANEVSEFRHPLFNNPLLTVLMALSKLFSWFGEEHYEKFETFGGGSKIGKIPTAFRTKKPTVFSNSTLNTPDF